MKSNNIKNLFFVFIIFFYNIISIDTKQESVYLNLPVNTSKMLNTTNENDLQKKMIEPEKYPPIIIVLHYTFTNTINQVVKTFYNRRVSSNFTIDRDGTIYQHIMDGNIAHHAGKSFWHGNYDINYYSKGIELINVGFDTVKQKNKKMSGVKKAANRSWESWSDKQIQAAASLIKAIAKQYNIKPWNIIGHSDCAPDRKDDPGPIFPWKKLNEEYEIGFWPNKKLTIPIEQVARLKRKDYLGFLHALGYPIKGFSNFVENRMDLDKKTKEDMVNMDKRLTETGEETIKVFKYHYMQDRFERDPNYNARLLDEDTKLTILKCVSSLINKDDYLLRTLNKLYANNMLSENAKRLINSLGSTLF